MKKALLALLFVVAYGLVVVQPSWTEVVKVNGGRDFATYHYAWRVARDGGDPYDKDALTASMMEEGVRKGGINPYFYPPPFLLAMAWDEMSLPVAYRTFYWVNQAAFFSVLLVLWRWFAAPLGLLAALALSFGPLPDNMKMGQANLPVLLLAVIGLWRTNGVALGAAAMAKMSPALYLVSWVARRRWTAVALAVATVIGLTLLSLPLVEPAWQLRFYTEVLPRFAGGPYHELTVPITLPANHSIPDLYNQLWPGPDDFTLSRKARLASTVTNLGLLGGLFLLARRERDVLGDAALAGAFTVLMVLTPVYTYEHHLTFLLLPLAAVGTALLRGRLPVHAWVPSVLCYALLAVPLGLRDPASRALPAARWLIQESKFFGAALLGLLCAWAVVSGGGVAKAGKVDPKAAKKKRKTKEKAKV